MESMISKIMDQVKSAQSEQGASFLVIELPDRLPIAVVYAVERMGKDSMSVELLEIKECNDESEVNEVREKFHFKIKIATLIYSNVN